MLLPHCRFYILTPTPHFKPFTQHHQTTTQSNSYQPLQPHPHHPPPPPPPKKHTKYKLQSKSQRFCSLPQSQGWKDVEYTLTFRCEKKSIQRISQMVGDYMYLQQKRDESQLTISPTKNKSKSMYGIYLLNLPPKQTNFLGINLPTKQKITGNHLPPKQFIYPLTNLSHGMRARGFSIQDTRYLPMRPISFSQHRHAANKGPSWSKKQSAGWRKGLWSLGLWVCVR